jgi:hypothetical protein
VPNEAARPITTASASAQIASLATTFMNRMPIP